MVQYRELIFIWNNSFALIFRLLNNEISLSQVDHHTSLSVHLIYTWVLFTSLGWCFCYCPDQAKEFITKAVSEASHFVFLIHALRV